MTSVHRGLLSPTATVNSRCKPCPYTATSAQLGCSLTDSVATEPLRARIPLGRLACRRGKTKETRHCSSQPRNPLVRLWPTNCLHWETHPADPNSTCPTFWSSCSPISQGLHWEVQCKIWLPFNPVLMLLLRVLPTTVHPLPQSFHQGAQLSRVPMQVPRRIRPMAVLTKLGKQVHVQ